MVISRHILQAYCVHDGLSERDTEQLAIQCCHLIGRQPKFPKARFTQPVLSLMQYAYSECHFDSAWWVLSKDWRFEFHNGFATTVGPLRITFSIWVARCADHTVVIVKETKQSVALRYRERK
jgi:hypothetical protein